MATTLELGARVDDPDQLARDAGVVVCMVYRSINYKSSRWSVSTRTPGGGGGNGMDYHNKTGAVLNASQKLGVGIILEAGPQRKDSFGYPDWPAYWIVNAVRKAVAS